MVGVVIAIRNPVLLGEVRWTVDEEFVVGVIVSDSGLHFDRVISESKLGQAEAANQVKCVNLIEQVVVSAIVQGKAGSSKQIELNRKFDSSSPINKTYILVSFEDIMWVSSKVTNADYFLFRNALQSM